MKKWIGYSWIGLLLLLTLISIPQCLRMGGESYFNARGRQSALDPQGPVAANQLDIFYLTLWVSIFLFITVGGALAFAIWKFRERKGDDPDFMPAQSHGHPLIEVGLVMASAALLVVIAIPTFGGIIFSKSPPQEPGEEVLTIEVTGYQWWWSFEYPEEGFYTANELVFPAGKPVKLELVADDVIHSFWLPKLAGKTDLIPGEENSMWIQADEPGYFWGQCAEYCGDSHAYMLFRAKALSEEEFEAWKERQKSNTVKDEDDGSYVPVAVDEMSGAEKETVLRGAELFTQHCARCHSVDSKTQTLGPNLAHFGSRTAIAAGWMENEPENLHRWIKEPHKIKPGNFMWKGFPEPSDSRQIQMEGLKDAGLTDEEVDALVAYLYTLK